MSHSQSHIRMNNISFIGMAGCGKSTLGSAVANKIASNFVDTDLLIEDKFKMSLEDVKNKFGYKFVRSAEEEAILSLNSSTKIISTGGSAVYSNKSMEHLRSFSKIVYIDTPLETIIKRIGIGQERGLAVPNGLSIPEVYSERQPLYEKFAEITLDGSKSIDELTKSIEKIIND